MRRTIRLTLFAMLALPLAAASGALNRSERDYLTAQLEESKKSFLASIAGLTTEQWNYKPAPNVWSVAECAEHIVLAEDFVFGRAQEMLKSPAVTRPATSNADEDRKIVALIEDRSKKATAPEPITPSGRFATPVAAAAEFSTKRGHSIAYVQTTGDALRTHAVTGPPLGTADAYQFLLLMAAHTGRHTQQIREVKAGAGFPKTASQFLLTYSLAKHGSVNDLTPRELAKIGEHAAYLASKVQAGGLIWGGRTMDASRPRGLAVMAGSEADARAFTAGDPAVAAGVFEVTVEPFMEAFRAKE